MSFKRDGDDLSLLLNLQKRRVSELLVSHIPEDEALLMRNGKFSCTVCSYRPVFDTLDILAVHRKGKKHLNYLTRYLHRQNKNQKVRDSSLQISKLSTTAPKIPKVLGDHHVLLKAKPYNSCMKRKPIINLQTKEAAKPKAETQGTLPESSRNQNSSKVVDAYIQSLPKKRRFDEVVAENKVGYPKQASTSEAARVIQDSQAVIDFTPLKISPETIQRKRECLQLIQSGWKKDWHSGKWVKDESVEFDSDEESPDFDERS